jgi:general secretion pathway protein M
MSIHFLSQYFTRYHSAQVAVYVVLVTGLFLIALLAIIDIADKYGALSSTAERLALIQGRPVSFSVAGGPAASVPEGSPFLRGRTLTMAGATLLQRVTAAISQAGGTVLSSEIAQERQRPDDRSITVIANCDLDESALQQLLYDLEAGMPFLFVDQLVVETSSVKGGRMQVRLGVSGLWLDEKG